MAKKLFLLTVALLCAVVQGAWAQTEVKSETELRAVIDATGSYKSVKMTADIQLGSHLVIENGKNVTLDLNGKKLSRSLSSAADDGNVIRVETGGQLTVKDSGNNSGQITGGKATDGGGICNHGTLTIEGGTITDCYAQNCGGGIFNAPATADGYPTTLTIKGGTVTGNTCGDRGAGIFNYPGCVLNIQGTVNVSGNTKGSEANNLYLDGETVITVTGALTGSHIGVSIEQSGRTITKDYKKYNPTADGATIFSSDNSQFSIAQDGDELLYGKSITFNVRSWDEASKQVVTTPMTKVCTPIEGNNPDGWMTLTNGYYVVTGNVEYQALTILGDDVHLILADGCNLDCRHIKLEEPYGLSIYSQSDGDREGKMTVRNYKYPSNDMPVFEIAAAIGSGTENIHMGALYIHGGVIYAETSTKKDDAMGAGIGGALKSGIGAGGLTIYGGKVGAYGGYYAAGIGGGYIGTQNGPVTVYGGKVIAEASYVGAGIGGGGTNAFDVGGHGGLVKIYGGEVTARAFRDTNDLRSLGEGAGIGAGYRGMAGEVHIYGGDVKAYGRMYSAGIGGSKARGGGSCEITGGTVYVAGGYDSGWMPYSCPVIGGGSSGEGSNVTITGGTVKLQKLYDDDYCPLIGGGEDQDNGTLVVGPGMKVRARKTGEESLAPVEDANGRVDILQDRCAIYAEIEPCDHQGTGSTYTYADKDYHNVTCKVCGYTGQEAHTYNGDNTCACGKKKDATADLWSVMLHRATGAASTSYADHVPMMVVKGQPLTVPAVSATQGLRLLGYVQAADAPTGIMMLETEKSSLIKVGDEITPTADMNLYARYGYVFNTAWTWAADASSASVTLSHAALSPVTLSSTDGKVTITPRVLTDDAGNVIGKRYVATCTYTLNGYDYTFTNNYQHQDISLMDDVDNSDAISTADGKLVDVTLADRTLYKDGSWNTLCLPFNLSEEQLAAEACPLKGATVKTLASSSFAGGTLTLNFEDATTIEAGKPYLVKWASGNDIKDPVFTNVTISNTLTSVTTDYVNFVGSFSPVSLTGGDRSVLYLGADNKLYYPSADMTVGSCRAVFKLNGITAGDPSLSAGIRGIMLNFDDETTGIQVVIGVNEVGEVSDDSWYSLDGRRLSGRPTAKGLYIVNGKKMFIK